MPARLVKLYTRVAPRTAITLRAEARREGLSLMEYCRRVLTVHAADIRNGTNPNTGGTD